MLMLYQFKHQAFGFFKTLALITVTACLLLIGIGQVYCYASDLNTIHTMQNIRIKDREQNNKQIRTKTKAYKELNKELRNIQETAKQLKTEKFRLLETLIFGKNHADITLVKRTRIVRENLELIYRFIEKDYPIERLARLEAVKRLQIKLGKSSLSPSLMEEFYNILHNEISFSQEDRVRTESIAIADDNIEAVTFNIGRVGYYFIDEEKKLAGLFSLKRAQWKLVDFDIYANNFKKAIEIIENALTERYIILPVEAMSKTNVE